MTKYIVMLILVMYSIGFIVLLIGYLNKVIGLNNLQEQKKREDYDSDKGVFSKKILKDIIKYKTQVINTTESIYVLNLYLENLSAIKANLTEENCMLLDKEIVSIIKSCLSPSDYVAVNNETEGKYYIVMIGLNSDIDLELIIQRVLVAYNDELNIGDSSYLITPYIGIVKYPKNGEDIDILMNKSETALTKAKDNEMNYYFYGADKKGTRNECIKKIAKGIDENQFILYYQPQYSLKTKKITGVEALLRWNHPDKGIVTPDNFIPLAESSGLIVPLGYWVLREACRQYKEWGKEDIKLSINLSAYQFMQDDLVENIDKILEEEGMNPNNLNLEITETTTMKDIELTLKTLERLRDRGISISIDDFGVGYSSLSYLRKFPINTLKIDRSFVWDISKDKNGEVVIKSIISMAKNLDLNVVAEGVEDNEQLEFLDKLECDEIQGYLIAPPKPPEMILDLLK